MVNKNIIVAAAAALVFGVAGYFIGSYQTNEPAKIQQQVSENDISEMRAGGYQYINPLLECDNYSASKNIKIALLEKRVSEYVQQTIQSQRAQAISVYFRDLNNGPWMGINENENYSPASLLKVPILIAVLKKAENEPGLLSKKLLFDHPVDQFGQNITDNGMIQPGKSYTVEDLLMRMIKHSDNEAKNLLFALIGEDFFGKVINELGLYIPGMVTEDFMSVKNYSSFFRILYNATYLNKVMSEKALSILSNTNFKDGIVAGVPQGVNVSHKFGERGYRDTNIKQLHDCGIVYPKDHAPYLICIMTRGNDFTEQGKIIAEISSIVYKTLTE
jgi:beta-lactamase class A